MSEVTKYHVLAYGSPEGYQTNRAQIALYGTDGKTIGYIRFNDPGMNFENDSDGAQIKMHLPSTMFGSVLNVLQNEKPVHIYYAAGRAFLSTSKEPVGEQEG